MIAHFEYFWYFPMLIGIVYVWWFREDQFDRPLCFRGHDQQPPGFPERAENDCDTCPWRAECFK